MISIEEFIEKYGEAELLLQSYAGYRFTFAGMFKGIYIRAVVGRETSDIDDLKIEVGVYYKLKSFKVVSYAVAQKGDEKLAECEDW